MARTNDTELSALWEQLKETYQQMNSTTSKAEAARLLALSEMLRHEYRTLSSTYFFS